MIEQLKRAIFRIVTKSSADVVVLWILGMVTYFTLGGFIHIFLVLAGISIIKEIVDSKEMIS